MVLSTPQGSPSARASPPGNSWRWGERLDGLGVVKREEDLNEVGRLLAGGDCLKVLNGLDK